MRSCLAALILAVSGLACASRSCPPIPTSAPMPVTRATYSADVDPEIARLFGDPPTVGRLPWRPTWSPDSWHVAYIRASYRTGAEPVRELWLHEMNTHRERPLVSDPGMSVSDFDWCGQDRLTFASGGDIYTVDISGSRVRLTQTEAVEHSPQSAPGCRKIAFVRDHNLFVIDTATRVEQPITRGGTLRRSFAEATWLYKEEFEAGQGFGWSPDGQRLWLYVTEAPGQIVRSLSADGSGPVQVYPMPGEPNPKVSIGVAEIPDKGEPTITWLDAGKNEDVYLPQVTWHPDSKRLLVARLDRLQTILTLLACSADTRGCKPLIEQRDPRWIDLPGRPRFIRGGEEFLWLTEQSGFSHIYRFGMDGSRKQQLTGGEWTIDSIDGVDEQGKTVYFTANARQPFSYEIYSVSDAKKEIVPVSTDPGVHSPVFSPDGRHYLDTHSALDRPPRTDLCKASGEIAAVIARSDLAEYRAPGVANDILSIDTGDGEMLMALLTRPLVLDPARRYPVLVYVYGGPRAQVVKNAFQTAIQPWRNLLAARGVLVFSVDGRGSSGRGHEFETAVHRRLGEIALRDQLTGVSYLTKQPFVDPDRVAIFGWSFGGTMALNALLHTETVFKAGVAVAPVTDWRQYDSAYTERYMQRPEDNPSGYREMSVLPLAGKLRAPLLLIHGLADTNVHFSHSSALVRALIDSGKYFETMFYPDAPHAISETRARVDLFTRVTRFIEEHL